MPTENVYRDTDSRYEHDPEFRAAVKMLEVAAERHGFTPGELKQIAFKAALNIEERRLPPICIIGPKSPAGPPPLAIATREEAARHGLAHLFEGPTPPLYIVPAFRVAGHLKDGTPVFYGKEP